jgi:hypothetical protein
MSVSYEWEIARDVEFMIGASSSHTSVQRDPDDDPTNIFEWHTSESLNFHKLDTESG